MASAAPTWLSIVLILTAIVAASLPLSSSVKLFNVGLPRSGLGSFHFVGKLVGRERAIVAGCRGRFGMHRAHRCSEFVAGGGLLQLELQRTAISPLTRLLFANAFLRVYLARAAASLNFTTQFGAFNTTRFVSVAAFPPSTAMSVEPSRYASSCRFVAGWFACSSVSLVVAHLACFPSVACVRAYWPAWRSVGGRYDLEGDATGLPAVQEFRRSGTGPLRELFDRFDTFSGRPLFGTYVCCIHCWYEQVNSAR